MATYLSPEQVAALIPGMTKGALAQLRFTGKGPRSRRLTPKKIIYLSEEVEFWVESTARYGTAVDAV